MLLFMDSFDHYTHSTPTTAKWNVTFGLDAPFGGGPQITVNAGRYLYGMLMKNGAVASVSLPDIQTCIVGFSYRPKTIGQRIICMFRDEGSIQCYLLQTSTGKINIYGGSGALLGTSSRTLIADKWVPIQFKIKASDALGTVELRIGGVTEFASVGFVDTSSSGRDIINGFAIGDYNNTTIEAHYDDLWVADNSGTDVNDFMDRPLLAAVFPRVNGIRQEWSVSAGQSYLALRDNPPNGDTSYIHKYNGGSAVNLSYYDEVVEGPGAIFAVGHHVYARKEYGNVAGVVSVSRPGTFDGVVGGTTDYLSTTPMYLQAEYAYHSTFYARNPGNGGGTWTVRAFNASQFGSK